MPIQASCWLEGEDHRAHSRPAWSAAATRCRSAETCRRCVTPGFSPNSCTQRSRRRICAMSESGPSCFLQKSWLVADPLREVLPERRQQLSGKRAQVRIATAARVGLEQPDCLAVHFGSGQRDVRGVRGVEFVTALPAQRADVAPSIDSADSMTKLRCGRLSRLERNADRHPRQSAFSSAPIRRVPRQDPTPVAAHTRHHNSLIFLKLHTSRT